MHFVLFSVLCSVTVAVLIKIARMRGVDPKQLIVWNYPVAILATYAFLKPDLSAVHFDTLPLGLYLSLGVLLPAIFVCMVYSIRYSGIVKTEVAQRLSLFIPLLAAFFLFGEAITSQKGVGIGVGLLAIVFSIGWKKPAGGKSGTWVYPLLVFLGMGTVDVLFKKIALHGEVPYKTSLWIIFLLAFAVALVFLVCWLVVGRERFDRRSAAWGMLLGAFNFGNILFYMKAHQALPEYPSVVFTGMNIGVISVGALVGVYVFGEKLSNWNKVGVVLAALAVVLIAYL